MKHIFEIKILFSFNIQIPNIIFFKMYFVAWKYIPVIQYISIQICFYFYNIYIFSMIKGPQKWYL